MNTLSLKYAVGFLGNASGTPNNANLKTTLGRTSRASVTGTTQQVLDIYQTTVGVTSTLQLSLIGGQLNPLGESITGTQAFSRVLGVLVEHDTASLATSGIQAFNGGTQEFQGPLSVSSQVLLLAGEWHGFGKAANITGWTAGATVHRIDVANLDTTQVATVNIFVIGSK